MLQPTEQDLKNAAFRQAIAEQEAERFGRARRLVWGALGTEWDPVCRRVLIDKAEDALARTAGRQPEPAATVITARHKGSGDIRYLRIIWDQVAGVHESYESAFGEMLREPHPTLRIEVRGQQVAPPRYNLCWAGYEVSHPRTAEQLAAQRERREAKAIEKAAAEIPLFAEQVRSGEIVRAKRKRKK